MDTHAFIFVFTKIWKYIVAGSRLRWNTWPFDNWNFSGHGDFALIFLYYDSPDKTYELKTIFSKTFEDGILDGNPITLKKCKSCHFSYGKGLAMSMWIVFCQLMSSPYNGESLNSHLIGYFLLPLKKQIKTANLRKALSCWFFELNTSDHQKNHAISITCIEDVCRRRKQETNS